MKATQKSRPTLSLAMIMKDEIEDLDRIVKDYGQYFDKIYVTVTHQKTYDALQKSTLATQVELSYFKWIDHFGKARLYNQQQVKTDYWMWIDLDDEIEGAENIPQVFDHMVTNNLDVIWFQYDYVPRVNLSDPGSILWRERIIKTAPNLAWSDVAVHETLDEAIQGDIKEELLPNVMIKHRKKAEQFQVSQDRNKLILEKDWQRAPGAITGYYLGRTLGGLGDYEGAIEKLLFAAQNSEIIPVRFGAWQNICECYLKTGQYDTALAAANEVAAIDSDHPAPWYQRFAIYRAMGDYVLALQSAEIAMSKRMEGGRGLMLTQDQSLYQYKGPFDIARAYLEFGNVERAYELYQHVKKIAPEYIDEQSIASNVQWSDAFEKVPDYID
jgi:tetratricopeptide (TPR) repeat protein